MLVIPSVDISRGKVVKLVRGALGTGTIIDEDPVSVALKWRSEGARRLHLIDINGAIEGRVRNLEVVKRVLASVPLPVQFGGGLRRVEDCLNMVSAGAKWLILGTRAVTDTSFLKNVIEVLGPSRVIVALDSKGGKLAVKGWRTTLNLDVVEVARRLDRFDLHAYLYTCVDVEGTVKGANLKHVKRLIEGCSTPVMYSGGVKDLSDIAMLRDLGVYGVIVGRALYTGMFSLRDAVKVAELQSTPAGDLLRGFRDDAG